jgi:hypothetical protein
MNEASWRSVTTRRRTPVDSVEREATVIDPTDVGTATDDGTPGT